VEGNKSMNRNSRKNEMHLKYSYKILYVDFHLKQPKGATQS